MVSVEWFENGETKGKEVSIHAAIHFIHNTTQPIDCVCIQHTYIHGTLLCWALFGASHLHYTYTYIAIAEPALPAVICSFIQVCSAQVLYMYIHISTKWQSPSTLGRFEGM